MFTRITGAIVERDEASVTLDVNGLAYEIVLPPCVAEKIPRLHGERVTLEIHPAFSLDGNSGRFTFFGFSNPIEREFFEALTTVGSIGPKTAARAFSEPMARIAQAIDAADHGFLVKLPGIGQQKARDIVAKLQGKVTKFLLIRDAEPRTLEPIPDFAEEALAVLLQLQYKRSEAEAMLAETLKASPEIRDAESLLAEVYRRQHRRAEAS
jgi:Holliday junction DNA helicase RuvA